MTVPLDRLYHFIEQTAEKIYGDRVIIYRFWPHGTKNIENLEYLYRPESWFDEVTRPAIYCHDQEPLMYEYYQKNLRSADHRPLGKFLNQFGLIPPINNLNYVENIFLKNILIHSEKQSAEVEKYTQDNQLIMVYYWSHAVIARDWYRFAEHVEFSKQAKNLFLIYNRAWSGTREYRLKFLDLLIDAGLADHCHTKFSPNDGDNNYKNYNYKTLAWKPKNTLENFFQINTADANSSADFEIDDYNNTQIEVVLETLFDDSRWHLTEKTLRPMACGQPFILAATAGSLKYLREYGFKTFDGIWSEDYDNIQDPALRLQAIVDLMQHLANLPADQQQQLIEQARDIANYNRRWFFSQQFLDLILAELQSNLAGAFETLAHTPGNPSFVDCYYKVLSTDQARAKLQNRPSNKLPTIQEVNKAIELCQALIPT